MLSVNYKRHLQNPDILYFLFAAFIVTAISAIHLFDPINVYSYTRDVWHHTAAINALIESPFHALNPHVVSEDPSRTFTPWYLLMALIGRALDLNATQALGVSALLSMIALVSGLFLFANEYFKNKWAPLILLFTLLGAWGMEFDYIGLTNFETMVFSASYPAVIVLAAGFFAWWSVLKCLKQNNINPLHIILMVLLPAFMFSTHQLQAGFAIGAMMVFTFLRESAPFSRRLVIFAATVTGFVISSFWIYYNPITFALQGMFPGWGVNTFWFQPSFIAFMTPLALMGLFGFYDYGAKKIRWDLVIGFSGILAGFVVGGILGNPVAHRFFGFLMFFLHLGLTYFLLSWPAIKSGQKFFRVCYGLMVYLLVMLGSFHFFLGFDAYRLFTGYGKGEIDFNFERGDPNILDSVAGVGKLVGPGDVIMAHREIAYPVQAHHMKVVSFPRPLPLAHGMAEFPPASNAFFNQDISNEARWDIIENYNVTHILYRDVWLEDPVQQIMAGFGKPTMFNNDMVLIVIDASMKPGDSP